MKNIVKATATVGIATFVGMAVGVVRSKFTALTIGPGGVGIFSQAVNFLQLAVTFSSLCIQLGVTKYISKYNAEGNASGVRSIIFSTVYMQLAACGIFLSFLCAFLGPLGRLVFSTDQFNLLLLVAAVSIPFSVLAVTAEIVLFGFGHYKAFAQGRVISNIISIIPLFVFISAMKLNGGFLYLLVNAVIACSVFFALVVRYLPRGVIAEALTFSRALVPLYKKAAREILSYGGISFIVSVVNLVSIVGLRSLIIRRFGAEGNGFYQVVFALSGSYLPFFTNGLWTYFYPKISALREDSREYSIEMNHAIRFCILGMIPATALLYLTRNIFIRIVFSDAFLPAGTLFSAQLFGDMFYLVFYILGSSLLAATRLRAYLIAGLGSSASYVVAFLLLQQGAGLAAIVFSYMIANLLWAVLLLMYHIRWMGVRLYKRTLTLIVPSITIIMICLFVGRDIIAYGAMKAALIAAWLTFALTRVERKKIRQFLTQKIPLVSGLMRSL